jgi:hypothetical protein
MYLKIWVLTSLQVIDYQITIRSVMMKLKQQSNQIVDPKHVIINTVVNTISAGVIMILF